MYRAQRLADEIKVEMLKQASNDELKEILNKPSNSKSEFDFEKYCAQVILAARNKGIFLPNR